MIVARPYQDDAVNELRVRVGRGGRSIVLVLPTGGGKTVIAAIIIDGAIRQQSRMIFCAHRKELITQAYSKLLEIGIPEEKIGVIMGNGVIRLRDGRIARASRPDAPIQVCSIDTLRRRKLPEGINIVFLDEAHRCLSASYLMLKKAFPDAIHLGLTATPFRNGNKPLGTYYDELVVGALPSQLVAEGFIVEPRIWTVPPHLRPDVSQVKTKAGDYDEKQLAEACSKKPLVGSIVDHWVEHGEGHRTLAFAVNVAHSMQIRDEFLEAGIAAEHVDGETPAEERDAIIARLERGETLVVCNCGIFTEGFDMPSVKCIILARPTKSTGLYMQCAGRSLRPWNGVTPVILDHAGACMVHGLPTDDREFSLHDKPRSKAPTTKTCPKCFAIVRSNVPVCDCGYEFISEAPGGGERTPPAQVDGKLIEVTEAMMLERRRFWDHLCEEVERKQYTSQWARVNYKKQYDEWPPHSFPKARGRQLTDGELETMKKRLEAVARAKNIPMSWVNRKMREEVAVPPPARAIPWGQLELEEHSKGTYGSPIEREDVDEGPSDADNDNADDSFNFGFNAKG